MVDLKDFYGTAPQLNAFNNDRSALNIEQGAP